jgi:tRNA dimethylallyltransferase
VPPAPHDHPVVVVAGPTGVGKSGFGIRLAEEIGGEIVNYDSVQLYRGFDIGSAKPTASQRARVPHHLFDVLEADVEFDAAAFTRLAHAACEEILSRGNVPIFVGGTGFYLRAFLSGLPEMPGRNESVRRRIRALASKPRGVRHLHDWLSRVDPTSGGRIAPADRHRVERALEVYLSTGKAISNWKPPRPGAEEQRPAIKIGLKLDRTELIARLDERVRTMYRNGLVDETRALLLLHPRSCRPFGTIGYQEAVRLVAGEIDERQAMADTMRRTRSYAKRQMTWLRGEQGIEWLDAALRFEDNLATAVETIAGRIKPDG